MSLQHLFIVHLVDVVTGQDQNVFRIFLIKEIEVLIYGIGCTVIKAQTGLVFFARGEYIDTTTIGVKAPG